MSKKGLGGILYLPKFDKNYVQCHSFFRYFDVECRRTVSNGEMSHSLIYEKRRIRTQLDIELRNLELELQLNRRVLRPQFMDTIEQF